MHNLTLILFRNYITALNQILYCGKEPTSLEYAQILSNGMSQPTTNLIASLYNVQPRLLMLSNQEVKQREIKEESQTYNQQIDSNHNYSNSSSSSDGDSYHQSEIYHNYYQMPIMEFEKFNSF
jgi:hypothetical protein